MKVGSLFAGIGGIDLSLEPFGFETSFFVENNQFAVTVLKKHWPDVPVLGDIKTVRWEHLPQIDALAGGFPCQDISLAGKGGGINERTRSGLWAHYTNAIRGLRPDYVFVENVAALRRRGIDRVIRDLALLGYDCQWGCFRASAIGAPHQRNRMWIVATHANSEPLRLQPEPISGSKEAALVGAADEALADSSSERWTKGPRLRSRAQTRDGGRLFDNGGFEATQRIDWGEYTPAIERWAAIYGPDPDPVTVRRDLRPEFVEWMMGFPEGWTDGIPYEERLTCLGNAVCPPAATEAWARLLTRNPTTNGDNK